MTTLRLRGDTSALVDTIAKRQDFQVGALRGSHTRWPVPPGRLDPALAHQLDVDIQVNRNQGRATYVVTDYETPIAWSVIGQDELVVTSDRYSRTTTRHQAICRSGRFERPTA